MASTLRHKCRNPLKRPKRLWFKVFAFYLLPFYFCVAARRYTRSPGVTIYQFCNGKYQEREFSPTFPMISGAVLAQFLQRSDTEDDNGVIRALGRSLKIQTDLS
jgi:hypothetical protein